MLFFISRSSTPNPRLLGLRIALFGVGAIVAVIGMGLQVTWLVNAAIVVLVAGFVLRFVRSSEEPEVGDSHDEGPVGDERVDGESTNEEAEAE